MDLDERFIRSALALSNIWSKDPSSKVCAIAVGKTRNLVAFGYNGFPPGIPDTAGRLNDREFKLRHILHAEVNALANATFPVEALYVTHAPCENCALHILARRSVVRLVYLHRPDFEARWADSVANAARILVSGGVSLAPFTFEHMTGEI